jgi:F-type H+-transporting ATPase subunit b
MYLLTAQDELSHIVDFSGQAIVNALVYMGNLIVIIAILTWLLYKPMSKFLNDRKERIKNEIDTAAAKMKDAEEKHSFYEGKLVKINVERDEILEEARKLAGAKEAEIVQNANQEASLIMDRAKLEIEREKEKAKDEMRSQIIQVSALMAERLLGQGMDEAARDRILNEAIVELGDAVWKG